MAKLVILIAVYLANNILYTYNACAYYRGGLDFHPIRESYIATPSNTPVYEVKLKENNILWKVK